MQTRGIENLIKESEKAADFIFDSLIRYYKGDWGEMCQEDKECNDYAVNHNERIFAAYRNDDFKIWIITEWDRSYTTILLPEEY